MTCLNSYLKSTIREHVDIFYIGMWISETNFLFAISALSALIIIAIFIYFFFFKSLQGKAFSIFSIQKSQCCPNLAQSHHAVKNYIRYVTRESRCGRIRGMHTTNWKYSQGNWENIFLGIVLKRWAKFYEL